MTLYDYDLVILGDSPAARTSAEFAARYRARVAWVQDLAPWSTAQAQRAWWGFQALREILLQRTHLAGHPLSEIAASECLGMVQQQAEILGLRQPSSGLAELGVDVIVPGGGLGAQQYSSQDLQSRDLQFYQDRRYPLSLQVHDSIRGQSRGWRSLQSRCYLLAPPPIPHIPAISGLEMVPWDTVQSWLDWPSLPQQVTVLGRDPQGIALAQMLARLGCDVTWASTALGTNTTSDATATECLAILLRGEGVKQVLNVQSLRVEHSTTANIIVFADDQRWATERLVIAEGWEADWGSLDLSPLGLRDNGAGKLLVNAQGRTPHRQVYAVGAALGRDGYGSMDDRAARIATRHILFGCRRSWPQAMPHSIVWTMPPMVRLGLSWEQAQRKYGDRAQCLTTEFQDNLRLQLNHAVVGCIQLVVHCRSGKLLGALLLGQDAPEWSGAIALALQQKLTVQQLAQLPASSASFAHLVQQVARQWRWQRLSHHPRREDMWERFFNWRRTGGV